MQFKNLFKPGRIGPLDLKNRIVMPAMGTGLAGRDGELGDEILAWYALRAKGGAGLITVEVCLLVCAFSDAASFRRIKAAVQEGFDTAMAL